VLVAHGLQASQVHGAVEAKLVALVTKFGPFGVRLFFAISGYLITSRFLDDMKEHGTDGILVRFYIRRAFRIIPPLLPNFLVLTVLAVWSLLPVTLADIAHAALFVSNYFPGSRDWVILHFWSLAVEEHFYLFWPPVLAIAGVRYGKLCAIAVVILVSGARTVTLMHHPAYEALGWTHLIIDFLMYAALLALLVQNHGVRERLRRWSRPIPWALLFVALIVVDLMTEQVKLLDLRFMEAMIFALIVALPTLSPEMAVTRWLGNPYMVWIGKRSYSIYIWQQLLFYPLGFSLLMNVVTLPVRIALVFTTAAISYRFIEQPMIQKGRVLERRVESRTAEQVRVSVASAD